MYVIGGDNSWYPLFTLGASLISIVGVAYAMRQYDRAGGSARIVLARFGLWATTLSSIGLFLFTLVRLLYPPHGGHHQGPFAAIALYLGIPVSVLGLLGAFAHGTSRRIIVFTSLVMTAVWFFSVLDNINW